MIKIAIRSDNFFSLGIKFVLVSGEQGEQIALIEKTRPGFVLSAGAKHKAPVFLSHFVQGGFRVGKEYKTFKSELKEGRIVVSGVLVFKWNKEREAYKLVDESVDDETWYLVPEFIYCGSRIGNPHIRLLKSQNATIIKEGATRTTIDTVCGLLFALQAVPGSYIVFDEYKPGYNYKHNSLNWRKIYWINNARELKSDSTYDGDADFLLQKAGILSLGGDII